MEILNNNQRRSAKWRLFFIGLAMLGITSIALGAIRSAYAGGGADELEQCRKEKIDQEQKWKSENQDLKNKNKNLKKQNKELKENGAKPSKQIKMLRDQIELKDVQIQTLERQLSSCKASLNEF